MNLTDDPAKYAGRNRNTDAPEFYLCGQNAEETNFLSRFVGKPLKCEVVMRDGRETHVFSIAEEDKSGKPASSKPGPKPKTESNAASKDE